MRFLAVALPALLAAGLLSAGPFFAGSAVRAVEAGIAPAASPIYGVTVPDGYRDWQLVGVAQETGALDELRAVVGIARALDAYRSGTLPFPDGTVLVKRAWTRVPSAEFAAIALFAGRLNRLLARWAAANTCYQRAEDSATSAGDLVTVLRSRLGRAAVARGQGNLPLSRSMAHEVAAQAARATLREVEAMAWADLGVVLELQGSIEESVQAKYRSFQLTEDSISRMRLVAGGRLVATPAVSTPGSAAICSITRSIRSSTCASAGRRPNARFSDAVATRSVVTPRSV